MKLFKCTIEASNSCYIQTFLVVAKTKEDAHAQIVKSRADKYDEKPRIVYKQRLEELDIDFSKEAMLQVGFGSNDSDHGWDD